MIEINLLPEKLRIKKRRPFALPALPFMPIAIGVVGLLIAFQVMLVVWVQAKQMTLNSLNRKYSSISSSNLKAIALDSNLKEISSKVDAVDKLLNSRFRLAKKLNDLSDSLVSGIWLKSIDIKKGEAPNEPGALREVLVVEGASIVSSETANGFIGKFVASLKENVSFSDDFEEIELSKVERSKIRKTEVMDFVIICHFKKGRGL